MWHVARRGNARTPQEIQTDPLPKRGAAIQVDALDAVQVTVMVELHAVAQGVATPGRASPVANPPVVVGPTGAHQGNVEEVV